MYKYELTSKPLLDVTLYLLAGIILSSAWFCFNFVDKEQIDGNWLCFEI